MAKKVRLASFMPSWSTRGLVVVLVSSSHRSPLSQLLGKGRAWSPVAFSKCWVAIWSLRAETIVFASVGEGLISFQALSACAFPTSLPFEDGLSFG